MKAPIFLIGAARSGTTVIGDLLGSHPDVAYWIEPKYVWRHGRAGAVDDARGPDEATPAVAAYIRAAFERHAQARGKPRFMEKTPSNCFRVAFMHRVFPDARFVHVQRDGRDAAASALARWRSPPDDQAIWRRIRNWEIPLGALHHYLPDIVREALLRRLQPGRGHFWGPRYPGWREERRRLETPTLCARQWVASATHATRDLAAVPAAQVHAFRYEDFVRDPATVLRGVLQFCGLAVDDALLERARREVRPDRVGAFQRLTAAERAAIEQECLPAMRQLGLPTG